MPGEITEDAGNDNHSLMNAHKWMKTIPGFHSTSVFRTPKFDPVKFVLNGPYIIYMDVVYVGFAGAKNRPYPFSNKCVAKEWRKA